MPQGLFEPWQNLALGDAVIDPVIMDVEHDGDLDLIAARSLLPGYVSIMLNRGDGRFETPPTLPAGDWTFDLAIGDLDLDGDGRIDFGDVLVVVGQWGICE